MATRAMDSLCHAVNRLEFSDEQLSKLQDALYRLYTLAPKRHWDTIAVSLARNNSAFDDPFARTSGTRGYFLPSFWAVDNNYYRGALWSLDLLWRLSGGQSFHRLGMVREHRHAMEQLLNTSGPRVFLGLPRTLWFDDTSGDYARARVELARAGLALKRYYLKYREFPEHLREVAPEFLAAIPEDPYSGRLLSYKRANWGAWVYSWGHDRKDNGGNEYRETLDVEEARNGPAYADAGGSVWKDAQRPGDIAFTITAPTEDWIPLR